MLDMDLCDPSLVLQHGVSSSYSELLWLSDSALFGWLRMSDCGSLHYKSKWLINGAGTGDTGSSRYIYTPIPTRLWLNSGAIFHFSLTSILFSLILSCLIHPAEESCLRSRSADRQMDRLGERRLKHPWGRRVHLAREGERDSESEVLPSLLEFCREDGCSLCSTFIRAHTQTKTQCKDNDYVGF